jgi:hypothetical protein
MSDSTSEVKNEVKTEVTKSKMSVGKQVVIAAIILVVGYVVVEVIRVVTHTTPDELAGVLSSRRSANAVIRENDLANAMMVEAALLAETRQEQPIVPAMYEQRADSEGNPIVFEEPTGEQVPLQMGEATVGREYFTIVGGYGANNVGDMRLISEMARSGRFTELREELESRRNMEIEFDHRFRVQVVRTMEMEGMMYVLVHVAITNTELWTMPNYLSNR